MDGIFDAEKFISMIHDRPSIWNAHSDDYMNKSLKRESWNEICRYFKFGYDQLTPPEQEQTLNDLQKRWKSLRNSFTRELLKRKRPKSGSGLHKTYVYFDHLSFLLPVASNKNLTLSPNEEEGEDDDDSTSLPREDEQPPPRPPSKKPKKDIVEQMYETLNQTLKDRTNLWIQEQDADRMFLLSLVKEMKKVPEDQKLLMKAEIMQIIHKYIKESQKSAAVEKDPLSPRPDSVAPHQIFITPKEEPSDSSSPSLTEEHEVGL